jgi:hypothetical protein
MQQPKKNKLKQQQKKARHNAITEQKKIPSQCQCSDDGHDGCGTTSE